jgi:hypothetical protein
MGEKGIGCNELHFMIVIWFKCTSLCILLVLLDIESNIETLLPYPHHCVLLKQYSLHVVK